MASSVPVRFEGFLFDLDGTLVQTPIDFAGMKRSVLELAEEAGLDLTTLNHRDILGVIEEAERQLETATVMPDFREQAEACLTRYELEAANTAEELPYAIETLMELKARGCEVAIVTRNCRAAVEKTLLRVPLIYDVLLTRNDVPRAKPDPAHLLEAAKRMQLSPDMCVMVGDHPMDMQAARGARMFCIGVQTRDPSPDAFQSSPPDVVLPSVGELIGWLDRQG